MKAITQLLIAVLLSTVAYADDAAKKEKLTATELQVVAHYHAVNLLEIDLGKTALKKAQSQAVKSYAEMLVKEHGEGDVKFKALAKSRKQIIPAEKPVTDADKAEMAETKKAVAALKKLKGADFEKEYLRMMVDGHDKELTKVDAKLGEVQDAELAEMVRAKKPVLQKHADAARELQKTGAQASLTHSHE